MTKHLPPVFGCAELARFLGWSTQRVRRWCQRSGIGTKRTPSGQFEITYAQILDRAPDVYYALLSAGALNLSINMADAKDMDEEA